MLKTTEQERQHILDYMSDQVSDEKVEFIQKVYSDQLHFLRHDIWDVDTPMRDCSIRPFARTRLVDPIGSINFPRPLPMLRVGVD